MNGFEQEIEVQGIQEGFGLVQVFAFSEGQGEGFEAGGGEAQFLHDVIGGEEDGSAVDST